MAVQNLTPYKIKIFSNGTVLKPVDAVFGGVAGHYGGSFIIMRTYKHIAVAVSSSHKYKKHKYTSYGGRPTMRTFKFQAHYNVFPNRNGRIYLKRND